ncbi:MAG: NUDIX hydrolase [Marinilabiliaceae bacterium]
MYKIFFKDRAIILTDHINSDLSQEFAAIHKLGSDGELRRFLTEFENNDKKKEVFLYHHNQRELLRRVKNCYDNIAAAGGLVMDPARRHFLALNRRGHPDLPKGKAEPGESFEEAARREVSEECGIDPPEIVKPLGPSFHIYYIEGQPVLKETRWFEMKDHSGKKPAPQLDEEITSADWLPVSEAVRFAGKTFPSIKEIMKKAKLI